MIRKVFLGDCLPRMELFKNNYIDLIITSPPYANQRNGDYGGIPHDEYVEWFLPITQQMKRVLKPDGTFILNIKENVINGERSTYVLELILALRKQGWLWTEEFIWHKTSSMPGKWPNRFRDSWEHIFQFNKNRKFNMYQEKVMVPVSENTKKRIKNLNNKNDIIRLESSNNSGFGKNISNWIDKEKVYPSNVLHFSPETGNKNHSAVFPERLPEWFIKLFTKENDIVLDPFAGSGTTGIVCKKLNRQYILIEQKKQYIDVIEARLKNNKEDEE